MKNSKYFPFERNKYFYGKLLSVDDFELEQRYMNDKRRLINRFMYGCGVVAGLSVVGIDDFMVSVEKGFALDYAGREIVVDIPVMKKLSLIDGFESYDRSDEQKDYTYLCIEYDEEDTDQVHSAISNSADVKSDSEYNKVKEGYRLFLTNNEPQEEKLTANELYENECVVYWGNGVRIKHTTPKFVRSSEDAILKITIENMGQKKNFSFSYKLNLTCFNYDDKPELIVSFDEAFNEKSTKYELYYPLKAHDVVNTEGIISMDPESFKISIDHDPLTDKVGDSRSVVSITDKDVREQIIKNYYKNNMEYVVKNNYQQSIYLAKIYLVRAEETYIIEKIENLPFDQVASTSLLNYALSCYDENKTSDKVCTVDYDKIVQRVMSEQEDRKEVLMSEGIVSIPIDIGARRGERFMSTEINHGLGIGEVSILTNIEEDNDIVYYGSSEVFEEQELPAEVAVKLDKQKGNFVIGVRLLEESDINRLDIRWVAIKNAKEIIEEKKERKIFIRPSVLNLKVKESYYLEVSYSNITDKKVQWSVEEGAGEIDANGKYTAPGIPGVYEVTAQSVAFPEVKAFIFVVVRDDEIEK